MAGEFCSQGVLLRHLARLLKDDEGTEEKLLEWSLDLDDLYRELGGEG